VITVARFSLNADSQTVRKQLITLPLEVGMVETGIDVVVEVIIVAPSGRSRRVTFSVEDFEAYV